MNEHAEMCECPDCVQARIDFNAWCDAFNERWEARKAAREHGGCGPLCPEHGSPLDTSIDVVRLGLEPR